MHTQACQTHTEHVSFSDWCENSQLIRISQEYLSHLITILVSRSFSGSVEDHLFGLGGQHLTDYTLTFRKRVLAALTLSSDAKLAVEITIIPIIQMLCKCLVNAGSTSAFAPIRKVTGIIYVLINIQSIG